MKADPPISIAIPAAQTTAPTVDHCQPGECGIVAPGNGTRVQDAHHEQYPGTGEQCRTVCSVLSQLTLPTCKARDYMRGLRWRQRERVVPRHEGVHCAEIHAHSGSDRRFTRRAYARRARLRPHRTHARKRLRRHQCAGDLRASPGRTLDVLCSFPGSGRAVHPPYRGIRPHPCAGYSPMYGK